MRLLFAYIPLLCLSVADLSLLNHCKSLHRLCLFVLLGSFKDALFRRGQTATHHLGKADGDEVGESADAERRPGSALCDRFMVRRCS